MTDDLPDALAEALGVVISDLRKEWRKELDVITAESRATVFELKATIADLTASLKEAAGQQIARVDAAIAGVENGKDADPAETARMVTDAVSKAVAAIPVPKDGTDGTSVTVDDVSPLIAEAVKAAVSDLPKPADGKDADMDALKSFIAIEVKAAVAEIPPPADGKDVDMDAVKATIVEVAKDIISTSFRQPADGKSVDIEEVKAILADEVQRAAAAIPVPAGIDMDQVKAHLTEEVKRWMPEPVHGKSVTVEDVRPMLEEMVAAIPPAKDGADADMDAIKAHAGAVVKEMVDAWERPKDGVSVSIDDVRPLLKGMVDEAVQALPIPKDGVGAAGAIIDRHGHLVLTLTNGDTKDLGQVVGKDADHDALVAFIKDEVAKIPAPKDGIDGLGFDDMTVDYDGERSIVLRWSRGEVMKEAKIEMPVVIDRGVFKDGGSYARGDGVTWGGSYWIAQDDTGEKPGDGSKSWRLAVKKGRDGKEVVKLPPSEPKPFKLPDAGKAS